MITFTVDQILEYTKKWLLTGDLNSDILGEEFHFISPFWESNAKQEFLDKFQDPAEYKEKSLSNIVSFDPVIDLKSDDGKYFAIIMQYHTKHNISVDEAVLGTIENGLLMELRSIYDLERTRLAHKL